MVLETIPENPETFQKPLGGISCFLHFIYNVCFSKFFIKIYLTRLSLLRIVEIV